jgi:hypothetical protein
LENIKNVIQEKKQGGVDIMDTKENKPEDIREVLTKLLSSSPFEIRGQWFLHQPIYLDGYKFVKCRFDQCNIITSKGTFIIENCFFWQCKFYYLDEALRVIKLHGLYSEETRKKWPLLNPTFNEDGTFSIT